MPLLNWIPSRHREVGLDPRLIVVATFCAIAVCKATTAAPVLLGFQLAIVLAAFAGGIRIRSLFTRSLLVLPFSLAALPLLFTVGGTHLFQLFGLQASVQGGERFLLIVSHCWLCYQVMLLGAATAGPFRFIQGLGRLGLPAKLVGILELALRYLDLLLDEAKRMRRAQRCRGDSTNLPVGERMRYAGQMLGTLFLRTLDRAERVQVAMKCRGLGGVSLQSELPAMSAGGIVAAVLIVVSTAGYLLRA